MRLASSALLRRVLLLFTLTVFLSTAEATAKQDLSCNITVNGLKRLYLVHLPDGKAPEKDCPLLIVLHGGMENGAAIRKMTGLNSESDQNGFIVVYPYGSGRLKKKFLMWNSIDCCGYAVKKQIDDVSFISELMDKISSEYKVDKSRIYVCGYSNGAMLALRLASELSDRIAAVASVGGSMSGKERNPTSPVSVLLINGTDDRHVPYQGGRGKWARLGYPVNEKPVSYALEFWKKADGCKGDSTTTEEGKVKMESYEGVSGTEVKLITLLGARHTWPGGKQSLLYSDKAFKELNASQECCRFLLKHRKPF